MIKTCHKRQVHAIGGMSAIIPVKGDDRANEVGCKGCLASPRLPVYLLAADGCMQPACPCPFQPLPLSPPTLSLCSRPSIVLFLIKLCCLHYRILPAGGLWQGAGRQAAGGDRWPRRHLGGPPWTHPSRQGGGWLLLLPPCLGLRCNACSALLCAASSASSACLLPLLAPIRTYPGAAKPRSW